MASDQTKRVTPQTLGNGVLDPLAFRSFSPQEAMVVGMYAEDPDVSLVVWNLEPGQENDLHTHAESAHVQLVLEGTGEYLRGDDPPVPINAGQCVVVPRGAVHGIRNTGSGRLSYLAVTTLREGGYVRQAVGGS
ncbi:MAG: cupin domain-containing protein [Dehalococcoidia bacterium]